jgi:hypothetical protein
MIGVLFTLHIYNLLLKRYVMPKTIMIIFEMTIEHVEVVLNKVFDIL